jgi:hypothetical protein
MIPSYEVRDIWDKFKKLKFCLFAKIIRCSDVVMGFRWFYLI